MKSKQEKISLLTKEYTLQTYGRQELTFSKGRGIYVWDVDGKKYMDFVAGVAVSDLGYAHPHILKTINKQIKKLIHCSNLYHIEEQALLAECLSKKTSLSKVFFCNSGAEAIETSLKLARYWGITEFNDDHYEIISCHQSFHGRTFGALSATGQKKYQEGFGPLVPGFKHIPFNDSTALKEAITPHTCAFIIEPIQGEGGVNMTSPEYLKQTRELCSKHNILLIFDEVQTGIGRTGGFTASEYYGVKPDIMALSKALGSGIPIGATLVNEKVASIAKPGIHASTFGGNALSSRVALETVKIVSQKKFLNGVKSNGKYFLDQLYKLKDEYKLIREIRGVGLMIACELYQDIGVRFQNECRERGLLINIIQNRIIRFIPPLIITRPEINKGLSILREVFELLN